MSKKTASVTRTPNVALSTLVQEVSTFLANAEGRLGPEPPTLTGTEKKRVAKPRKGADKILATIAPIVEQHGLESRSLSAAVMMSRLEDAQTLQPLQTRLQKIQKRVDDELFSAQADAWRMGLQFYSLLKHRAKGDGELAKNIEPLVKTFAYRHTSVKGGKPTKVQTRAKAKLKSALELAARHDVAGENGAGARSGSAAPTARPVASAATAVTTPTTPEASAVGATSSRAVNGPAASGSHS